MNDLVVYVFDADWDNETNITSYAIDNGDIEELVSICEKNNSVYSIREFESGVNFGEINLNNSYVYFKNRNVK